MRNPRHARRPGTGQRRQLRHRPRHTGRETPQRIVSEQPGHRHILVDRFPVQTVAAGLHLRALRRRGVEQARKPRERHPDDPAIRQVHPHHVPTSCRHQNVPPSLSPTCSFHALLMEGATARKPLRIARRMASGAISLLQHKESPPPPQKMRNVVPSVHGDSPDAPNARHMADVGCASALRPEQ